MDILIWFAILVIIVIVLWFLLNQFPLPEPAGRIVTIAIVVVVAVIAIGFLLQFAGGGHWPRLR